MLNKNERMNKLNAMGINTGKYFTVPLENGGSVTIIIDENGNPVPGRRSVFSRLVELASRLAISGLHNLQSGATIPYQRFFPVSRGSLFNKTTAKQQGETL